MMLPNINRWRLEIALWLVPDIFKTPAPADAGAFREGYRHGMEEAARICDQVGEVVSDDLLWVSDECAKAIRGRGKHD